MRLVTPMTMFVIVLLLAGCASRPAEADLTSSILEAAEANPDVTLDDAEAACIAGILLDSELSDTTLTGLAANFTQPEVLDDEAEIVQPLVAGAAQFCLAGDDG